MGVPCTLQDEHMCPYRAAVAECNAKIEWLLNACVEAEIWERGRGKHSAEKIRRQLVAEMENDISVPKIEKLSVCPEIELSTQLGLEKLRTKKAELQVELLLRAMSAQSGGHIAVETLRKLYLKEKGRG